ncbi:hypothetical protein H920_01024 [Fukomys damarensis]|uniref:Uncharacterized protein n=1 Tax=Fukomys damarensis TaxID=885580 RepID=A0A091DZI4_FUKDA|nr:hypothetical protein H920_01024 [Fukomys damarensis]
MALLRTEASARRPLLAVLVLAVLSKLVPTHTEVRSSAAVLRLSRLFEEYPNSELLSTKNRKITTETLEFPWSSPLDAGPVFVSAPLSALLRSPAAGAEMPPSSASPPRCSQRTALESGLSLELSHAGRSWSWVTSIAPPLNAHPEEQGFITKVAIKSRVGK